MTSGALQQHGLKRVSDAGHSEGHPKVQLADIRPTKLSTLIKFAMRDGRFTPDDGEGFKV